MRRTFLLTVTLCALLASGGSGVVMADGPRDFAVPLFGSQEVPPRGTSATGVATFHLSEDESALTFNLVVADITNVVQAHIHLAPVGVAGPIVAQFLFGPVAPAGGPANGLLAQGTFTAANLVGPLQGHPFSDLVTAIRSGNAYVNVHTDRGFPPHNTGPGDFPSGEIRGQF